MCDSLRWNHRGLTEVQPEAHSSTKRALGCNASFSGLFQARLQNLLSCRQGPKSFCFKGSIPKLQLKKLLAQSDAQHEEYGNKQAERKKGGAELSKKEREKWAEWAAENTKGKRSRGEVAVSVQIWHPIASPCTLQEQRAVQLIVSWFLISIHQSARQSWGHVCPGFWSGEELSIYTTIKTLHGKQDYLRSHFLASANTDSICEHGWFPQAMFTGNVALRFKTGCLN